METNLWAFKGTENYIASEDLQNSVNVAIALGRPLLIKGEPGTGKTMLAGSIAEGLGKRLLVWNIKSTTRAQEGLYVYDTVQRLYDSQFGDHDVSDISHYIRLGKLGEAFTSEEQALVLGGIHPDCIAGELPFIGVLIKKNRDFEAVLRRLHERGRLG